MTDNDTSFYSSICSPPDLSNITNIPVLKGKLTQAFIGYEDFLTVRHVIIFLS